MDIQIISAFLTIIATLYTILNSGHGSGKNSVCKKYTYKENKVLKSFEKERVTIYFMLISTAVINHTASYFIVEKNLDTYINLNLRYSNLILMFGFIFVIILEHYKIYPIKILYNHCIIILFIALFVVPPFLYYFSPSEKDWSLSYYHLSIPFIIEYLSYISNCFYPVLPFFIYSNNYYRGTLCRFQTSVSIQLNDGKLYSNIKDFDIDSNFVTFIKMKGDSTFDRIFIPMESIRLIEKNYLDFSSIEILKANALLEKEEFGSTNKEIQE